MGDNLTLQQKIHLRWPWMSVRLHEEIVGTWRETLAQLENERDRLREQNDKLVDHIVRVDRIEHGAPELPRQTRPANEPMPYELLEYINSCGDERMQKMQRDEAFRRHFKLGQPWQQVMDEVMPKETDDG